jgi:predicted acetyltransferase
MTPQELSRVGGASHQDPSSCVVMAIEVRGIREGETTRLREVLSTAFGGGDVNTEWDPVWEHIFEKHRLVVAEENGEMVGVAGNFSFEMTVPGATVPTAGLTIVGVLPTHRRKGILKELMRTQLDDAHSRAEPLSILWASEEIIYQRFGYGLGSMQMSLEVDRGHTGFRNDPGPSGRARLLSEEEALKVLPDIYERVREVTPGMQRRDSDWWKYHRLFDPPSGRDGASALYRVVWEGEGRADAYALYRVKEGWDYATGLNEGSLRVFESMSTTPEAHRELWRYLFGVDLVQKLSAHFLPIDDPLPLMLLEPRHLRQRMNDALWLRVVDVAGALAARTYETDDSITFALTDAFRPDNEGTWKLAVTDSRGKVERTSEPGEMSLDASDLGSAYLGAVTFQQLARADRVRELKPGAVARADAMFRSTRSPWCPEIF